MSGALPRKFVLLASAGCALVNAAWACGCYRSQRPAYPAASKSGAAATAPTTAHVGRRPTILPAPAEGGAEALESSWSVLQHEYLASELNAVWVEAEGGRYSAGYYVPGEDDGPGPLTLYVVPDMTADYEALPNHGPISSSTFVRADEIKDDRVIAVRAPVRYRRRADGRVEPGFFEPAHGVFFRWRGQVRRADQMDFMPSTDPIPLEVHAERASDVIDIDPPEDMDQHEPLYMPDDD